MAWIQLHFQTTKEQVECIEGILYLYDAQSILLNDAADQPLLEPLPGDTPLWDDVVVVGLFTAQHCDIETIQAHVSKQVPVQRTWVSTLADTDWERAWMDHYQPIQCADNLWVVPKWLPAPNPAATNVLIDPGLAFGTGYHASTQLCLAWLATQHLENAIVIDYGCGSGILGIAALKLGAKQVYAVDIDPQAIIATQQNAALNHVDDALWAGEPKEFAALDVPLADVLVANILAKPLKQLAPQFASLCREGTLIALAGLIEPQTDDMIQTYAPWFALTEKSTLPENWVCLSGKKS